MRLAISAAGTPSDVRAQVAQQTATWRREHPASAALAAALRDQIGKRCDALAHEDALIVEASVEVVVIGVEAAAVSADVVDDSDEELAA